MEPMLHWGKTETPNVHRLYQGGLPLAQVEYMPSRCAEVMPRWRLTTLVKANHPQYADHPTTIIYTDHRWAKVEDRLTKFLCDIKRPKAPPQNAPWIPQDSNPEPSAPVRSRPRVFQLAK